MTEAETRLLERVTRLIKDYGERFWLTEHAEKIIQHIEEGLKNEKDSGLQSR